MVTDVGRSQRLRPPAPPPELGGMPFSIPIGAPVAPPLAPRQVSAPLVRSYLFSTDDLPISDRFEAWRHSFAPMVDLNRRTMTTDFQGSQTLWDLGGLGFSRIRTGALAFSSRPPHLHSHPLDHWVISLLLCGQTTTTTPTHSFECGPGIVQVHPLGRPFHGAVSDSEMLMLWIPRDFCRDSARVLDAAEFSTLDTAMGRMFAIFMVGLAHQVACLRQDELPRLLSATREMILACVARSRPGMEDADRTVSALLLERARQFVQDNLYSPKLGVEMLMRELAVSRTRLYRLFEPAGGVNRYIQHRRLLDAHSALANPSENRRILEIAEQRGFDGAEFSRAFKREFGYSPSHVRKGERAGAPSSGGADLADLAPQDRLGSLLRRLQNGASARPECFAG